MGTGIMTLNWFCIIAWCIIMGPSVVQAQTTPEQTIQFGIVQDANLTPEMMAILKLHPVRIEAPTQVFKFNGVTKQFGSATLQPGDTVAVNDDGSLAYQVASRTEYLTMTQRQLDDYTTYVKAQMTLILVCLFIFVIVVYFSAPAIGRTLNDIRRHPKMDGGH
jgi:hypothetical protein